MKRIKKGSEVKRVSDKIAEKLVSEGWKYCPKSVWKQYKLS
jgi:hypothetical protein